MVGDLADFRAGFLSVTSVNRSMTEKTVAVYFGNTKKHWIHFVGGISDYGLLTVKARATLVTYSGWDRSRALPFRITVTDGSIVRTPT